MVLEKIETFSEQSCFPNKVEQTPALQTFDTVLENFNTLINAIVYKFWLTRECSWLPNKWRQMA